MNKSDFIDKMASLVGSTKADAGRSLQAFLDTVTDVLKSGEQLIFPGFGTFSVGARAARTGRNPNTGKEISIKATKVAKFKAGSRLKEAVQKSK